MSEQTALALYDHGVLVITITIERDYDGRWTSRWPAAVVLAGESAGAGRHDTRQGLVAAIELKGWALRHDRGDEWRARKAKP